MLNFKLQVLGLKLESSYTQGVHGYLPVGGSYANCQANF